MRAKINYQSVRTMLEQRLCPEPLSKWGTYPELAKNGDIVFYGHAPSATDPDKPVTFTRCRITPDGTIVTSRAHLRWLQGQVELNGFEFDLVLIPPPPPQVKLEKNRKKPFDKLPVSDTKVAKNPGKPAAKPSSTQPALSLAERLKAIKNAKES